MSYILQVKDQKYFVPLSKPKQLWAMKQFDKNLPLVILITGWMSTADESGNVVLKLIYDAFRSRENVNFVVCIPFWAEIFPKFWLAISWLRMFIIFIFFVSFQVVDTGWFFFPLILFTLNLVWNLISIVQNWSLILTLNFIPFQRTENLKFYPNT